MPDLFFPPLYHYISWYCVQSVYYWKRNYSASYYENFLIVMLVWASRWSLPSLPEVLLIKNSKIWAHLCSNIPKSCLYAKNWKSISYNSDSSILSFFMRYRTPFFGTLKSKILKFKGLTLTPDSNPFQNGKAHLCGTTRSGSNWAISSLTM